jgi:biotin carboxylase
MRRLGAQALERGVIVEEFLVGDEYSVEAISARGRHHILAITKKYKDPRTFVELGHVLPAPLSEADCQAIGEYVRRILGAFGYRDCPSHTEVMLTAAGPRIVETHTRVGGDRIMDLLRHASGIDVYELVARQSIGEDISARLPAAVTYRQSCAVWYAAPEASVQQELAEVRGVEAAAAPAHVKRFELLRHIGSSGVRVSSSFERSAAAVAVGADAEQALERARRAIASLEFLYKAKAVAA